MDMGTRKAAAARTSSRHLALLFSVVAGASPILAAGCDLDVPDLNDPGLGDLAQNPTPAKIAAAVAGLVIMGRDDIAETNGYISHLGILGRESYNFDTADPRFITQLLEGTLAPGDDAFGGNFWAFPYRNIRNGNVLLTAVDVVVGLTDAEKQGVRGFAKTIAALDYLKVINTHDTNGAVIQRSADLRALDPIVGKAEVFAHIKMLLDEARDHLMGAGDEFFFKVGSGFTGFDTPATFLRANRAIRARADVYTGDYAAALTALGESFITADPASPRLELGISWSFGTGSGDEINRLTDPNLLAHPSVQMGAEMRANGMPDRRVVAKLKMIMPRTARMLTTDRGLNVYTGPTSPVPIVRNEDLILLRAEARSATGDLMGAIADVNFIREQSGGLAPRTDLTMDNILDEILKQRLYSLFFEGHRWIDMRRTGKLEQLPLDRPEHKRHAAFPIPMQETDARM
jgi:starch-binding outer membrane protein, SusD/RagB family